MKISVFGTGYVGLVTGVCFAEMGNNVICADIDDNKIQMLRKGQSPIYEPGLDDLIENSIRAERIHFTTDLQKAVHDSEIIFIAVGTPSDVDGSADLKYVLQVAKTIAEHMNGPKHIITKSTVPVGTHLKVRAVIEKELSRRGVNHTWYLASNPEFLREGSAIEDCLKPDRVVVGCEGPQAEKTLRRLYEPFLSEGAQLLLMDLASAEMTKYAANAMLATKISLMNEFSRVCDSVGANIEAVRVGIGADHRIGPHFIYAGIGYGGSCFPKDVKALVHIGKEHGNRLEILEAVESVNYSQRERYFANLKKNVGELRGKKFAVWGVAFKPGTDDIRDAPALDIIAKLLEGGATVQAYDPVAKENCLKHFASHKGLSFGADQYSVLADADALCILTEWKSFREPDFARMKASLKRALILDGRNIYGPNEMKELGIEYHSIGRPRA